MLVTRRNVKRHGFLMLILAELVQGVRYLKPISRQKHVYVKRVITARLEIETLEERFRISDAVQGAGVSKNGSIETHWERRNSQPYFEARNFNGMCRISMSDNGEAFFRQPPRLSTSRPLLRQASPRRSSKNAPRCATPRKRRKSAAG